VNKGRELTRGKTKILFELEGQPDVLVVSSMDQITAGDGARRNIIEGKGRVAAKTTARIFRLLNLCGLPTHFLSGGEDDDDNEMLVRRAEMIPLEVVTRGVAAGSLLKRKPGIQRGALIIPRLIEFFIKDDANHDPQIEPEDIVARGIATPNEIGAMTELARMTFEILAHAWRRRDTLLVDLKIEFGRLVGGDGKGSLVIADVIDNDSWRVWPQGREELMLDKQVYRNLETVTSADLDRILNSYEQVAELVASFPVMRPGMVAMFCDGTEFGEFAATASRAMQQYGLPLVRHVVSVERTPGFVLQLAAQLDATFSRLVYVAVGDDRSVLARMLEGATANPVIPVTGENRPDEVGLSCAKLFALDDTVVFGRVLLVQANQRSLILQADAALNAQTMPNGTLA
jgi:phosphoribosylaminoimidazole-succinocarboxamide synthase